MRLQGKVVMITGSGSGLGREGALLFARISIIFPTDLGRSDDITAGSIPAELRTHIRG